MDIPLPRRLPGDSERRSSIGRLINDYEAEEERIVNLLSRKLEQLQEEKIQLANTLDAENESLVNRLTRQLVALRQQQIQQQQQAHLQQYSHTSGSNGYEGDSISSSPVQHYAPIFDPRNPSADVTINVLRRENEMLRNKLVDTEREFIRMVRLNDVYREELIEHRRRLGIPIDTLLVADTDPLRQPIHRRRESSSSPMAATHPLPGNPRPSPGPLPIPRPPSQIHRPQQQPVPLASAVTTSSNSPSSSLPPSPFPFSPNSAVASPMTNLTTPASVPPLTAIPPQSLPSINQLTYPHVPPPSLSSSLGSPVSIFSPVSGLPSRRNSVRVAESGSLIRSRRNTSASATAEVHHIGRGRAESSSGFTVFGIDEVEGPEEGTQNP